MAKIRNIKRRGRQLSDERRVKEAINVDTLRKPADTPEGRENLVNSIINMPLDIKQLANAMEIPYHLLAEGYRADKLVHNVIKHSKAILNRLGTDDTVEVSREKIVDLCIKVRGVCLLYLTCFRGYARVSYEMCELDWKIEDGVDIPYREFLELYIEKLGKSLEDVDVITCMEINDGLKDIQKHIGDYKGYKDDVKEVVDAGLEVMEILQGLTREELEFNDELKTMMEAREVKLSALCMFISDFYEQYMSKLEEEGRDLKKLTMNDYTTGYEILISCLAANNMLVQGSDETVIYREYTRVFFNRGVTERDTVDNIVQRNSDTD